MKVLRLLLLGIALFGVAGCIWEDRGEGRGGGGSYHGGHEEHHFDDRR